MNSILLLSLSSLIFFINQSQATCVPRNFSYPIPPSTSPTPSPPKLSPVVTPATAPAPAPKCQVSSSSDHHISVSPASDSSSSSSPIESPDSSKIRPEASPATGHHASVASDLDNNVRSSASSDSSSSDRDNNARSASSDSSSSGSASFGFSFSAGGGTHHDSALQKICGFTDNPTLCVSTISPVFNGKTDPISVLEMSIKACTIHAKLAIAAVKKLSILPSMSKLTKSVLGDCEDSYSDVLDNLQSAMEAIPSRDVGTINSMLSAAVSDFSTCEDGFAGGKSLMADFDNKLMKMASNCLAIASMIK